TSAAAARVTSAGPWFLPDGELALDRTQLVAVRGNIDHPIDVDELVQSVSGTAWTGTGNDLFNDSTCGVWTDSTMSGETGNVTGAGSGWSARSKVSCTAAYHLYCFEN
ncbi:MAG TPA: hypothetical protein VIF62_14930, partial [Labilithrix sp.]